MITFHKHLLYSQCTIW